MSITTESMTPADVYACTRGNDGYNNGGMFGNDSWAWLVILILFGWGGRGFGFGGGFGGGQGGCGCEPCATQSDVRAAVDQQTLISKLDQQTYGLADSTYALNNTINQNFRGVDNAICSLGYNTQAGFNALSAQLAQCCCDNRAAIADVKYTIANEGCDTRHAIYNSSRDIIDNANANSRAILDALNANYIRTLESENNSLKLSASQANQNAVLMAAMDANKAEILRRTGAECPVPAYVVSAPTPVNFPTNCCGQVQFAHNGCGCGSY